MSCLNPNTLEKLTHRHISNLRSLISQCHFGNSILQFEIATFSQQQLGFKFVLALQALDELVTRCISKNYGC
jgi:hypothetical protein